MVSASPRRVLSGAYSCPERLSAGCASHHPPIPRELLCRSQDREVEWPSRGVRG
ncbi:hypothetical protein GGTG_06374 [Gaeumannomyces tritici R3-111a-1]|uniref:Uncharacterized protein n=1 Tax=Gaeumannomyces tritici (strain R3-111a-1) TaxID=644352 RepID=J3NYM2_GAET3|nr:hypothetical protein GGTG_06374 [Gaeumannomyces tritici R3-111a-1]EJT76455.1 hypothetical protein GGTG_06374 [Gaeumannomyces tritici R3-111a-1]